MDEIEEAIAKIEQAKDEAIQNSASRIKQILDTRYGSVSPKAIAIVFAKLLQDGRNNNSSLRGISKQDVISGLKGIYRLKPVEEINVTEDGVEVRTNDPIVELIGDYELTDSEANEIENLIEETFSKFLG